MLSYTEIKKQALRGQKMENYKKVGVLNEKKEKQ